MEKFSKTIRLLGVSFLVVFNTLALTGCFDVSQVFMVAPQVEDSTMKVTLTTYNEDIFDSLKSSLTGEEFGAKDVEMDFNVIEPDSAGGETKYQMIMQGLIAEDTINVFPYGDGNAYEIKLVTEEEELGEDLEDTEEEDEEEYLGEGDEFDGLDEDMTRSMFRGYQYEVSISLPEPVVDGWWGTMDEEEEKTYFQPGSIAGGKVQISAPIMEVFTEHNHVTIITDPEGSGTIDATTKKGEEKVEAYQFGKKFAYSRLEQIEDDAEQLENLFYLWKNGRVDYAGILAQLGEVEKRSTGYLDDLARASVPEELRVQYRQANYIFSSWKMVVGMFHDGLEDLDLVELSAAYTAMGFLKEEIAGL